MIIGNIIHLYFNNMILGRSKTGKAIEEAASIFQSKDDGCFAQDGSKAGKWCYWSALRAVSW